LNQSELTALLTFAAAMSFSPGPNTTLSTALAANRGMRAAIRFCLAVPVGWALLILTCGLGLGALILNIPPLRWSVKVLGVGYLLWLAWKLLRQTSLSGPVGGNLLQVGFIQGVLLQFVNIKAWMLALTVTAGWVVSAGGLAAPNPSERLAIVAVLMAVFAFSSNFTYAVAGSLMRGWLETGQRLLWFNRFLAMVLAATGAWMLLV
jgi:threonine/homoserine/homoserine lactone efflux protein